MKTFKYYKIFLGLIFFILISGCDKNKKPWPIFPKEDGGALTETVNLPFTDSLNYGSTVATFAIPPGWLEAFVTGSKEDRGWAYRPNYGTTGVSPDGAIIASAFGGNLGNDNVYLIRGPFNLASYSSLKLTFDVGLQYNEDPGTINFKYSTNYPGSGNPEAGGISWTSINEINSLLPTSNTGTPPFNYVPINANFTIPQNNVFIAIHFSGGNNVDSKQWRLDNFNLKAN